MTKTKRAVIQTARVILAFFTVMWTLSLMSVFATVFGTPDYFALHWLRVSLAIGVVFLPAWGYIKLTEMVTPTAPKQLIDPALTKEQINRIAEEGDLAFKNGSPKSNNPYILPNAQKEDLELASYWDRGYISAERKR